MVKVGWAGVGGWGGWVARGTLANVSRSGRRCSTSVSTQKAALMYKAKNVWMVEGGRRYGRRRRAKARARATPLMKHWAGDKRAAAARGGGREETAALGRARLVESDLAEQRQARVLEEHLLEAGVVGCASSQATRGGRVARGQESRTGRRGTELEGGGHRPVM